MKSRLPKSNPKLTLLLLLVLIAIAITVKLCGKSTNTNLPGTATEKIDRRTKDFRRHPLEYTEHALCRMDCRKITEAEVQEVLEKGNINQRKSEKSAKPCPTYALEDYVNGKKIRVVVGDCKTDAVIITVIDLDHEFECHCPGDNK